MLFVFPLETLISTSALFLSDASLESRSLTTLVFSTAGVSWRQRKGDYHDAKNPNACISRQMQWLLPTGEIP